MKLAAAGPLAGFSLGIVLLVAGFILPPSDGLGIIIDPEIFHESFLAGGIGTIYISLSFFHWKKKIQSIELSFLVCLINSAKLILGDVLKEGSQISINPLILWAWAGLLINAINSIPAGELDGGRIAFSLWGRKVIILVSSNSFTSFHFFLLIFSCVS